MASVSCSDWRDRSLRLARVSWDGSANAVPPPTAAKVVIAAIATATRLRTGSSQNGIELQTASLTAVDGFFVELPVHLPWVSKRLRNVPGFPTSNRRSGTDQRSRTGFLTGVETANTAGRDGHRVGRWRTTSTGRSA